MRSKEKVWENLWKDMKNSAWELSRQELWWGMEQMKTQSDENAKSKNEKWKFDMSCGFYCRETDK